MTVWIIVGISLLFILLFAGGKRGASGSRREAPHWIYHPHVVESDDYECSCCHARFRRETAVCPKCGSRMSGKTVRDDGEWNDEEDELEILFDED